MIPVILCVVAIALGIYGISKSITMMFKLKENDEN
jgi:hypothetical protein